MDDPVSCRGPNRMRLVFFIVVSLCTQGWVCPRAVGDVVRDFCALLEWWQLLGVQEGRAAADSHCATGLTGPFM